MSDTSLTNLLTNQNLDLIQELDTINTSNFRFQNQKALLTYKTHIDKASFWEFLKYTNGGNPPKTVYIAHENGLNDPITPYEHTHVVVDFGKKIDRRDQRFLDFNGIHPHISVIKQAKSWKKACLYICKEDKTVVLNDEDKFGEQTYVTNVWQYRNVQEALKNCTNMKDVLPTIALMKYKDISEGWDRPIYNDAITSYDEMRPFQKKLHDYVVKHSVDNREIYWIYDQRGLSGKNSWLDYMEANYPGKLLWLSVDGKAENTMMLFIDKLRAGWRGDTIVINLARSKSSCSDFTQLYTIIENIKDGRISHGKYEGALAKIPTSKVVVLANVLPEISRLSLDRWKIFEMGDDFDVTYKDVHTLWKTPKGPSQSENGPRNINIGGPLGQFNPHAENR